MRSCVDKVGPQRAEGSQLFIDMSNIPESKARFSQEAIEVFDPRRRPVDIVKLPFHQYNSRLGQRRRCPTKYFDIKAVGIALQYINTIPSP